MKRGFTLIELLVVIAIIAILAAILFPVFAQAKAAAKKASALSNVKQTDLAIQMYLGDADDKYPTGFGMTTWTGTDLWLQIVQPYTKSLAIYGSPADGEAGHSEGTDGWAGIGVSFAANGVYGPWCCSSDGWSHGFVLQGPMGVANQSGWLDQGKAALNSSELTQVANTILLSEKHGADVKPFWTGTSSANLDGNASNFWMNGLFLGDNLAGAGSASKSVSGYTEGDWGPTRVPDGRRYTTDPWPVSQDGSVSAKYNGQAVFAFCDGHAASKKPVATNPNPDTAPEKNLWNGLRTE